MPPAVVRHWLLDCLPGQVEAAWPFTRSSDKAKGPTSMISRGRAANRGGQVEPMGPTAVAEFAPCAPPAALPTSGRDWSADARDRLQGH